MRESVPPDPHAETGRVEIPISLIARLQDLTGADRGPVDLPGLARARAEADWTDAIGQLARDAGLEVRPLTLDADSALAAARREAPLLAWHAGLGWLVLTRDGRGRALLEVGASPARRIDAQALEVVLGRSEDVEALQWLLVRAALPTHPADQPPPPFQRLIEILRPDRMDILSIVIYAVFIGLLSLAIPVAVQQLVNSVAFGGLVQPVVVLALLLFVGLAIAASLTTFQAYLAEILQRRIFVRACVQLADRLPRVPLGAFGPHYGPERTNRFFDLITLQKTGARLLLEGSAVLLQTTTGLLILSFYHPLMLGLSVVLIALMGFVVFGLGRGATPTALAESSAKYAIAEWLEELTRHAASFRSESGREYAIARADALATNWIAARGRHYRVVLRQLVGALGLQVVVNSAVLALGGFLVVSGELTLGQLVASEIIVAAVVVAFARLGKQLESFYDLLAAVDKVGTLFDLPVEHDRGSLQDDRPADAARIEAIDLAYADHGPTLFGGLDLRFERGERVALTGPAGSGKSTLIDLLCGLRAPSSGRIEIDGVDMRELRLEVLREGLFCIREAEIFSGTVFENLQVARRDATSQEVIEALDRVGLLAEIRALPDGIDTRLTTEGAPLSRSQAARLMFARAWLARPRLLAVDGELPFVEGAERERLLDALFSAERPFTLIVASSQPDVVTRCDRSLALADPRRPRLMKPAENESHSLGGRDA